VLGRMLSVHGHGAIVLMLIGSMTVLASCRKPDPTGPVIPVEDLPIESLFLQNDEGWTAEGDGLLYYSPTAGNPPSTGYIFIIDQTKGATFYFAAPAKFLGDASAAHGRALTFDLVWSQTSAGSDKAGDDVIIEGAGLTLVAMLPEAPGLNWTSYSIPLSTSGGWVHQGTDLLASAAEIQAVLGSLERLWIRGEFRHGAEQGGLDNVRFGA
jgi:hypothetical protein